MTREEAKGNLIHAIRWNDMPNKEALNMAIKALEQQSCEDCVSREALLAMSDYIGETPTHSNPYAQIEEVVRVKDIEALPSVSPKYNTSEWCHDCSEYDHDKHCCPRFNKVIRNTFEKIKQAKAGHWIE